MLAPVTVTISQRGVLTLPKEMRDAYQLEPGDDMTLIDLGGVFVLSPGRSKLGALADQVTSALTAKGDTLESMLTALREERERYGSR
jgi:bifunctional DNA-binding transcriptional regulator/antitoxin component of YhaV-PrlF toxin-antitoxin module